VSKRFVVWVVAVGLLSLFAADADAARRKRRAKKKPTPEKSEPIVVGDGADPAADTKTTTKGKDKVYDFTVLNIEGKLRTPQLLYFLGRARQELERAALESRSFIPEMVESIEEEGL
jgi:hypothetical protein